MRTISLLTLLAIVGCGGAQRKPADEAAAAPGDTAPEADGEAAAGAEAAPAPEDDVKVEGTLGTIDPAEAQEVMRKALPGIERCYKDHLGTTRYVGGDVVLKIRVRRDGFVARAQVAEGDLGRWEIEKCIIQVVRGLSFPRPKGGEAEFAFPITFPQGRQVVTLDEGRAASELGPHLPSLAACGAAPVVDVVVYAATGGAVTSAGFVVQGNRPLEGRWGDCAAEKAKTWKLSDPRGGVVKARATWTGR